MAMTWEEITKEWEIWENMSCKAGTKRLKPDTVIDEEKSVRWNREEVERLNKEHDETVAELNTKRNKARDALYEHIYEYIIDEVGKNCSRRKAIAIWNYAFEQGHAYGLNGIYSCLNDIIDLAITLLNNDN